MNFTRHFEPRQSNFYYDRIAKVTVLAILFLQVVYFLAFLACYLLLENDSVLQVLYIPFIIAFFTSSLWFIFQKNKTVRTSIIMLWAHLLSCIVSFLGIFFFGWGYGYYLFMIMAITLNYVHNFKTNFINVAISCIELVVFLCLLCIFKNKEPIIVINDKVKICFYLFHFIFVVATLIIYANMTNISRKIVINTLENKKNMLEQRGKYDFLTGSLNRRSAREYLDNVLSMFRSKKIASFVFCIGDLDNFKKINDNYGHNFGDNVLRETANIIHSKMDLIDGVCARWGGEEFVVILSNISLDKSLEHIESIRKSISGNVMFSGDMKVNVSISFGFVYVENDTDVEDIIKQADNLLYDAKLSGKNQTKYSVV